MSSKPNQMTTSSEFYRHYRGAFSGILRWEQLDSFWAILRRRADAGWYVYAIGEPVPQQPLDADHVNTFITEIDVLLHREHDEDYCGIVYADDRDHPTFIKIYDPNNLGVVCGFSDNPPLPGWIMSLLPPEELNEQTFISQSRRRWWQRLF